MNIPARKTSNDSGSTVDIEIDDEETESAETTQRADGAENIEESDAVENKIMSADNNGLFNNDHEESLYHPIYSLENLDYFLRHPDKISTNFNPIRSHFLPNYINKVDFKSLSDFNPKFPYELLKIPYRTLKRPQDSTFAPELIKKGSTFTETKLRKVIQDLLKKPSLLLDTPFLPNPSEHFRISSEDDIPVWNFLRHNFLQQLSNNVNYNKAPLEDHSHENRFQKVFNIQQESFLSSRDSWLPRELLDVIDDFFNNISVHFEPRTLKSFFTLIERLLNVHPSENLPSLKVQHSTSSSLLQQSPFPPSLHEDDYLSQAQNFKDVPVYPDIPPQSDNLDDISPSFIDNNRIFPENSPKDDDHVPKDLVSIYSISSLVQQHRHTKVPLLELTTSPSKVIPQQSENMTPNNNVSSLVDRLAVFDNDSLNKSIVNLGNLSLSANDSQTETGKSTDFSSFLENKPFGETKTFEFFSVVPAQAGTLTSANNVSLDKSLLPSEQTLSPSDTIVKSTKNTKIISSYSLLSQNPALFNETQSPGNLTFIDKTHTISPEYNSTSDKFSPFKLVVNSEDSQNKLLHPTVYLDIPLFTGINVHNMNKMAKLLENKNAQNMQNERYDEEKIAQVGVSKKEENPDCLKGDIWISKCHECICSDNGFPDCKTIQDCVLPPLGKYR